MSFMVIERTLTLEIQKMTMVLYNRTMIEQYCARLKNIQEEKMEYLKTKEHLRQSARMHRQEIKYQVYITDQMNFKNKLIAVDALRSLVQPKLLLLGKVFLTQLSSFRLGLKQTPTNPHEQTVSCHRIRHIWLLITQMHKNRLKQALWQIVFSAAKRQKIGAISKVIQKCLFRTAFRRVFLARRERPFEEDFSAIIAAPIKKGRTGLDESQMSFILDKDCQCSTDHLRKIDMLEREQEKLRDELAMARNLIVEKMLALKEKDKQLAESERRRIQLGREHLQRHQQRQQSSKDYSMRSSYYGQLDREVIGDSAEVNGELVSKYMRQTFQMRQRMDQLREIVEQLQPMKKSERVARVKMLRLLGGEEESLVD